MIRKFENTDIEQVMQIWLNGNIEAHPFISKEYWESNYQMVQEQIQQAEVYLAEEDGEIQGFIGIVEGYIAGFFVRKMYQSKGIGKQILEYVKERYEALYLNVYQKNKRAVNFYHREGFHITSEEIDEETGEMDLTMTWRKMQE